MADTPAATATTAVAAVNMDPAALSIATAAAVHYGNILGHTPDCSAITLSQTEFYANKAIGGGGGAIFWDGPVEDLIVICSDIFGEHRASLFALLVLLHGLTAPTLIHILTLSLASRLILISLLLCNAGQDHQPPTVTQTLTLALTLTPTVLSIFGCNTASDLDPNTDLDPETDADRDLTLAGP